MPVLMRDLTIGLGVLIVQILMKLGMLLGAQALLMRIAMRLVQLIVNVGMFLIELLMLSAVTMRGVGERRDGRGEGDRTDHR